jgi:hypothetical protein
MRATFSADAVVPTAHWICGFRGRIRSAAIRLGLVEGSAAGLRANGSLPRTRPAIDRGGIVKRLVRSARSAPCPARNQRRNRRRRRTEGAGAVYFARRGAPTAAGRDR